MQHGTVFGGQVGGVDDVLHAHWQAEQRAVGFTPGTRLVGRPGLRQHMGAVQMGPGLHLGFDGIHARQQRTRVVPHRTVAGDQSFPRFGGAE